MEIPVRMSIPIDRRNLLRAMSAGAVAFVVPKLGVEAVRAQQANSSTPHAAMTPSPKALLFDTFGTVVDWHGAIVAEGTAWAKPKGLTVDWSRFADQWEMGPGSPIRAKIRTGELPWTKFDVLYRRRLEELLIEFHIPTLTEEGKDRWNHVWHRMKPWPDSVAGLTRLKKKYVIAPLSNGNVSLLIDMAKNGGLPWDAIFGAELAKHYKPDREVYMTAVDLLSLTPQETMMVAAHTYDLNAARSYGLRTAFIYRPNEKGPGGKPDQAKPGEYDIVASSILDLASQLGA